MDYIDDYITLRRNQDTPQGTLKEFISMKNRLIAFNTWRNKKTFIEDVNITWSNDFEVFLRKHAEHNRNGELEKGYSDGTIRKTYTILTTVLNYYYEIRDEQNIPVTDKFRMKGFKRGKKSINKANPLTMEQLDTLYAYDFKTPSLNRTKIRFCWQCYTSLRFGDIDKIRPEHNVDGFLQYKPVKTERYDKEMNQPLNDQANEILEMYDHDTSPMKISYQPYMRQIREMFDIIREKKPKLKFGHYTTHSGRDTYISICVQRGVNMKNILDWVGHSSYQIMDRYIKQTDKSQKEEARRVFKRR